jgi:hypothetical protein
MREVSKVNRALVGNYEGRRPVERPRRRWEEGIRMDIREISWGGTEWIQLAQDRGRWQFLVNTVTNLRVWGHGITSVKVVSVTSNRVVT